MGCLLVLIGLFTPRLVLALLWLASDWFSGIFHGALIPILGFIFLPYTLLWYTVVINWFNGVWGFWQVVILILAILTDLSANGGSARKGHKYYRR
ncbi:MAG TPA: hypothetical protein VJ991_04615 [Balneolales bacterium]|nr:hypothetical protein [Balneolales bacterium]